ncbi:MAG TPA: transposase [Vicinamibacterales bacterium]|nr:transposase [Vicinamibacterales bacterium]
MEPKPMRRLPQFPYTGPYRYSLTFCTERRAPLLRNPGLVDCVCAQILRAATLTGYAVVVYCAMPDHMHLLADGRNSGARLPGFVQRAKQLSGYYGQGLIGRSFWQVGYHERVLRPSEDIRESVRYIVNNPVRAGLAAAPVAYPFIGSGMYSRDELFDYIQVSDGRTRPS